MNYKTNYALMKNAYYSNYNNAAVNYPPGFSNPTKKPPQLNYLILHYLIINLPLQKAM